MILDHLGHEAVEGAPGRDDQMQHGGAAPFLFQRALDCLGMQSDGTERTLI
jgi:hypothetical protein